MVWQQHMGAWAGFDDGSRLVARVFRYDVPDGWRVEVRGQLVDGILGSDVEARAVAEQRVHAAPSVQRGVR